MCSSDLSANIQRRTIRRIDWHWVKYGLWVCVGISEINCGICKHLSILLYLAPSIINRTKKSFILNIWFFMGIKLAGNKVWNYANRWNLERWHGTWFWKNVYSLSVNFCYGTSFLFNLHSCILFNIEIFIILTNVYTLITVYFCVCRWKVKKSKQSTSWTKHSSK